MNVLDQWAFIGVFFVLAPVLPAGVVFLSWVLSPSKPNAIKTSTYECGVETVGDTWVQFKAQYYIYGLIFLVWIRVRDCINTSRVPHPPGKTTRPRLL